MWGLGFNVGVPIKNPPPPSSLFLRGFFETNLGGGRNNVLGWGGGVVKGSVVLRAEAGGLWGFLFP